MSDTSPWVVNTTTATFEQDVLEQSKTVPVVVDFWAPWCGPCRQLAPILEKVAHEASGKFILVKVDTDANQDLAAAFGIQSIPLVVAFSGGQPVNQFMGVMPEEEIKEWLATFLPSEAEVLVAKGNAVEESDPAAAEQHYRDAHALDPKNAAIKIHLARVLEAQSKHEEAAGLIEELEARGYLEPEAEQIKAQLDLEEAAEEVGGIDEARAAVQQNPEDLSLRLKLADVLAVNKQYEEALQICLELVQRDKSGIGVDAKETMVKIFELPRVNAELVSAYRRKLSTAFY